MIDTTEASLQTLDLHGRPISPNPGDSAAMPIPTSQPERQAMTKSRGAAAFLAWFTQGVNDAVTGALLPYIEAHYGLSYALASLIFVANAIGFIAAAPFVQQLDRKFGRSRTLATVATLNAVVYAVIISEPPFAIVAVSFVVLGESIS